MFKKLCSFLFCMAFLATLAAEDEYEVRDIGTLQTCSSQAIAINNQGQILGWYNIDGSTTGKHFFFRDKVGSFFELPIKDYQTGQEINWRFLTNDSKAYGTTGAVQSPVLYIWDQKNGVAKLGNLPGEISAINNKGQVLIKSIMDSENGKSVRRPIIWQNGQIIKLNGLVGNAGILSDESYGLDMNNKGEVVGKSLVYLVHKNNIYKQIHAVKWVNGTAIDLHNQIPKNEQSSALAINDLGQVIITTYYLSQNRESSYQLKNDGSYIKLSSNGVEKINNLGYTYFDSVILNDLGKTILNKNSFNDNLKFETESIWITLTSILNVNDKSEIVANGKTIWGEEHAMLLVPVNSD